MQYKLKGSSIMKSNVYRLIYEMENDKRVLNIIYGVANHYFRLKYESEDAGRFKEAEKYNRLFKITNKYYQNYKNNHNII